MKSRKTVMFFLLASVAACGGVSGSEEAQAGPDLEQQTLGNSACAEQLPINLRSAGLFSVLAGSTVTNTGPTRVIGTTMRPVARSAQ
jgi:hypothetical protein